MLRYFVLDFINWNQECLNLEKKQRNYVPEGVAASCLAPEVIVNCASEMFSRCPSWGDVVLSRAVMTLTVNEQQSGSPNTYLHNYFVGIYCRVFSCVVDEDLLFLFQIHTFLKKKKLFSCLVCGTNNKNKLKKPRTQRHTRYLAKVFVIFVTH